MLATPPSCQGARLKDGGLVVGAGVGLGDGLKDGPAAGIGTETIIVGGLHSWGRSWDRRCFVK